jgi:hypothetical protein
MTESGDTISIQSCRHEMAGHCTLVYWNRMREGGREALVDYECVLWRRRMEAMSAYRREAHRAHQFGLTGEKREQRAERAFQRIPPASCPEYRPRADRPDQCRHYFHEACALLFPACPGSCPDFLAPVDQT